MVARADRIARDDGDAPDDAVGEEGVSSLREEVRLVAAQDERRERVRAPGRARAHGPARARVRAGRRDGATARSSPRRPRGSPPPRAGAARAGTTSRTSRPGASEPPASRPSSPRPISRRANDGAQRLVGGESVRHSVISRTRAASRRRRRDGRAPAVGWSPRRGRRSRDAARRGARGSPSERERAVVQAVEDVQERRSPGHGGGDLPGPPALAGEAARREEQRGRRQHPGRPGERPGASGVSGRRIPPSAPGRTACRRSRPAPAATTNGDDERRAAGRPALGERARSPTAARTAGT